MWIMCDQSEHDDKNAVTILATLNINYSFHITFFIYTVITNSYGICMSLVFKTKFLFQHGFCRPSLTFFFTTGFIKAKFLKKFGELQYSA